MAEAGLLPQTVDYKLAGPYYGDKNCCVVDNGLYTNLAQHLAKTFASVFYYSPWESSFPRANARVVGSGIHGVIRIDTIWDQAILEQIDLFVFPDIFYGELQLYLRSIGKRVWGSGLAERLEIMRPEAKRWFKELGLPVGNHAAITGTKDLRTYLQRHDDQFVKIARSRGDMETFHAKTFQLIEPRLDELEYSLGAKKYTAQFVSEDRIDAAQEIGYDGFTIDGQFPKSSLFGIETKDNGYVGRVMSAAAMPRQLGYVNSKLAPLFKDLKYRGFWSSELRITEDGTPFLIDPCCRMPSPPGELYQYMITNLADIIWMGAAGALVEPKWRFEWGALLVLKSQWAQQGWQPIAWPDALADQVKLHYHAVLNGKNYFVPQAITFPEIGSVVAGGNTKQEAIDAVIEVAKQIEGYDVSYDVAALGAAAEGMALVTKAIVH